MNKKLLISTIVIVLFSFGCSDYQSGYQDGYEGMEQRWTLFGYDEYSNGYQIGKADKFQEDWESENAIDIDDELLQCRDIFFEVNHTNFSLQNYTKSSGNVYSLKK